MGRYRGPSKSIIAALTVALALSAACSYTPPDETTTGPSPSAQVLSPALQAVIDSPEYRAGTWALYVVDADSGESIYQMARQQEMLTGSTAKIFSVSTALDELGTDYRFRTPVVRIGPISSSGELAGNLVFVGRGDLTLGGRTKADGTVNVPTFDHYDANALPGLATITPEDPLAGINELAQQVAAKGIKRVQGDVVVDDRLWDPVAIGGVPITPTVVNDNLIDILITPGKQGALATVTSRPQTAMFRVDAQVTTGPPGVTPALEIDDPEPGVIRVRGTVNVDATPPVVAVYQVPDPAAFARTVFIEALGRAGVTVDGQATGANPSSKLPSRSNVAKAPKVAEYVSPPYSEYARLINKVSHNLGANLIPPVVAVKDGERTYAAGMAIVNAHVRKAGIDPSLFTLVDAEGLEGDKVAPEAQVEFLRYLTGRSYFKVFFESTPVIGVDGSLATVIPPDDPAKGHISAKTGTLVGIGDDGKFVLETKALAGYIDVASGRRLAFAIYLNFLPISSVQGVLDANNTIGGMASSIYKDQ